MTPTLRLFEVLELRAAVADRQVVDKLHLARLHGEVELQVGVGEDALQRRDGRLPGRIQLFAAQDIGVAHLMQPQACLDLAVGLDEDRCGEGRVFV